jgi:hypothetical protein
MIKFLIKREFLPPEGKAILKLEALRSLPDLSHAKWQEKKAQEVEMQTTTYTKWVK